MSARPRRASKFDQQEHGGGETDGSAEMFQIFGTVEDSSYVVCVPPTATHQVGFSSKALRSQLMTAEDLACFYSE